MSGQRILRHPIISVSPTARVTFTWKGQEHQGVPGEALSSALAACGVKIFGHHSKDGSPQGLFCANGQCSQCLVRVNGNALKACMTPLRAGMQVEPLDGLPELPETEQAPLLREAPVREVEVLVVGGGPAGLAAAIELGRLGVDTLLVDDKSELGGKLLLQTHKFFGSVEDTHAGKRGFEIAKLLSDELAEQESVDVWLNTTLAGIFSDSVVGLVRGGSYRRVAPQVLLVAAGARERMLSFPGNTLPGVYGAGAFQTLVNRDLVRAAERILIVGGGNVGLIAAYHALQAGMQVEGVVEAMSQVGGYRVHAEKIQRAGVPIFRRHTVVAAWGKEHLEAVTIAALDEQGALRSETQRTFRVDTLLVAVGLAGISEPASAARECGLQVESAGDALEISEASAAVFSGRLAGRKIAASLGLAPPEIPPSWEQKAQLLKSRPGKWTARETAVLRDGRGPVIRCNQEIPCNPCVAVCPKGLIRLQGDLLTGLPVVENLEQCTGCMRCVAVCPGLAVTLVDYRGPSEDALVTVAHEMDTQAFADGEPAVLVNEKGAALGSFTVHKIIAPKGFPGTKLLQFKVPKSVAGDVAGIRVQQVEDEEPATRKSQLPPAMVCRCERVGEHEIRAAVRAGIHDVNQLKALTRVTMGACGGKTCTPLIRRIMEQEGVAPEEITENTLRPLFIEVPMSLPAGARRGKEI